MKTKNLLFAAGLPIVLAACTNDEFTQNASIGEDKLGKLIETPMLGVDVTDANTKAYVNGSWQWLPTMGTDENAGQVVDVDRIGLCWTGVNNGSDYAGPLTETGDMVYTNVKFEQVGWLYEGEDAPTMHCGILENGEYHNYVSELTPDAKWNDQTLKWEAKKAGESLNYGRAMFKSGNGTIYEGEYIVYFPYNSSFWNAPVTAKQERIMEFDVNNDGKVKDSYQMVSKNAFNVGYVKSIKGGDEACMFGTNMLTSGIEFQIKGEGSIKEIVLWSKGEEAFKISQAISAKKVKEAILSGNGLSNTVYMDNAQINETSSTLVARVSGEDAMKIEETVSSVYVPFLPTSFTDLHALVVAKDGTVANVTIGEVDFEARDFRPMLLKLGTDSEGTYVERESTKDKYYFTAENYAYDEPSFVAAYNEALGNAKDEKIEPRTVTLLDNITLTRQEVGAYNEESDYPVIIKSEPEDDVINTLTLSHTEKGNGVDYTFRTTDFNVNVVTNPQGCCNNGLVNLTLRESTTGEGTNMTIYGGKLTLCENINLRGNIYSKFEPVDEEGEEHPERVPEINIVENSGGNAVVNAYAEFLNEGKMTIKTKQEFNLVGANMTNKGDIDVKGNGNSGENAKINMDEGSVLTNNGDIYNMGDIDNDHGDFTNQTGATFTDYVGSSLSGDRIVNEGGDFISEVNSVVRYNQAIDLNGVRPTTILRFVYGTEKNIGKGDFTTTYTLTPNNGDGIYVPYGGETLMKFESAIEDGNTLNLNNDAEKTAVEIVDFTVKSGMITINHVALTVNGDYKTDGACNTWMPEGLTVTGDMNLAKATKGTNNSNAVVQLKSGKELTIGGDLIVTNVEGGVIFEKGSKVEAANLIVAEEQHVEFQANVVAHFDKEGEGVINNNGTIDITNTVSGSDSPAIVWCNSRDGDGEYPNGKPQY